MSNIFYHSASGGASAGRPRDDTGFTLIELIVVVVIAMLSAIGLPVYSSMQDKANDAAVQEDLHSFQVARAIYTGQGGTVIHNRHTRGINFQVAIDSYEVDDTDHNLVYCLQAETDNWHLLALSKSGNAFAVGHDHGVKSLGQWWGEHQQNDL